MGVLILTFAIIGVASYVFQLFWKAVLKFCYYLLLKSIDVVKKIIVATKRFGKCVMYLYRRYKNGKIVRIHIDPEEEEVDVDMLPKELQEQLGIHNEVIVRDEDIKPEEFE